MTALTITETLDIPFRWINQMPGAERWAWGMLRLEPIPTNAVEYGAALSEDFLPEPFLAVSAETALYYSEAVSVGVRRAAQELGLTGIRVTLTQIEAHPVDSSSMAYEVAAFRAIHTAIEAHGVPVFG